MRGEIEHDTHALASLDPVTGHVQATCVGWAIELVILCVFEIFSMLEWIICITEAKLLVVEHWNLYRFC